MNEIPPDNAPLFDLFSPDSGNLPDSLPANEKTEKTDGEKFVVFFLDDELFAIAAGEVGEIVRPLDFTPLPTAPGWLCGIANLRGAIISVLNLSKICQKNSLPASSKSRMIVLKPKQGASSMAFPVDRLSEIITLSKNDIHPAENSRFYARAVHETVSVNLLDIEKLVSSLF